MLTLKEKLIFDQNSLWELLKIMETWKILRPNNKRDSCAVKSTRFRSVKNSHLTFLFISKNYSVIKTSTSIFDDELYLSNYQVNKIVTHNFFLYNHQQHLDVCRQTNQTYFRTLHVSKKGAEIRNFRGVCTIPILYA